MLGSGLTHSPADGAAFLIRIGSALGLYIRLNAWLWTRLPSGLRQTRLWHAFGTILHDVVRRAERRQFTGTFFFRKRPQLELMRRLSALKPAGATVSLAIFGCSIGAEIYSILSTIRSARPDLKASVWAVDLDVRAKVAGELGWRPVLELIEDIHEGDPAVRQDWPCKWWGLEPLDKSRADWKLRYASAFLLNQDG